MNKTVKIILAVVAALGLSIGGWVLFQLYGPKTPIESVLPKDAIAYGRMANASEHLERAKASPFWQSLASINMAGVLKHNNFPESSIDQVLYWQKQGKTFLNNPVIQKFLGKEIALGVYQHSNIDPAKDPEAAYGVVLVLRLVPSIQVIEALSRFSHEWGDGILTSVESYNGKKIIHVHVRNKQDSFQYVRLNDLLIVTAEGEGHLKATIDTFQKKYPSLNKDEDFIFAKSRSYEGDGIFYLNVAALNKMLKSQEWMEDVMVQTTGFKSYTLSYLPGNITKYKLTIAFDPKAIRPALRRILTCAPKENPSLKFVPPTALAYQWSGCYDFKESWQQFKEEINMLPEAAAQVRYLKKGIERRAGFKFGDDVLPLLGQEAGGYFIDMDTLGILPFPRFLAFVRVNDKVKTEALFRQFAKTPFGLIDEEKYGNVTIRYLNLPVGANTDPSYAFIGDYFLFSSTRQLLKKSIDLFNNPAASLAGDRTFASLGLNATEKVQNVAYVKTGPLAHSLQGLVRWGNRYLMAQASGMADYRKQVDVRKMALVQDAVDKESDLTLALAKLAEWKGKPAATTPEEQGVSVDNIAHLEQDVQNLRDEIKTIQAESIELDESLVRYQAQVESNKILAYHLEHVVVPVLRAFESVNAQGMKIVTADKTIETEFMFN